MLMTDDTGWNDFGAYGGGQTLGDPTPNVDRVAQEGAVFPSWYGQASCTAGRADSSSNQRLKYLNSSRSMPCSFQLAVQG